MAEFFQSIPLFPLVLTVGAYQIGLWCQKKTRSALCNPLLIAVVLSAQCTDKQVNKVTDVLFKKYNTAEAFSQIDYETLEPFIHSCGFFRMKGHNILAMSRILTEK